MHNYTYESNKDTFDEKNLEEHTLGFWFYKVQKQSKVI